MTSRADIPLPGEWVARADCRRPEYNPDWWYPGKEERKGSEVEYAQELRAKLICASCPVREECLTEALRSREPHGVWGGLSESERHLISEHGAEVVPPSGDEFLGYVHYLAVHSFVGENNRLSHVAKQCNVSKVGDLIELLESYTYRVAGEDPCQHQKSA